MRGALAQGLARLEARLEPAAAAPVAVALSGGGDSTALLLIARRWAAKTGRPLVGFTVDHQLQAAGADWALRCAALCTRLGVPHRTLAWTGDKPAAGLPAAARAARHRLIAEAARAAGAHVVLMGHTADDVSEAAAMRAAGSTVPDPREWAPSPVWPQGRGVLLLRPLLGVRREALRAFLGEAGEAWIEDPANQDRRFARARARQSLSQSVDAHPPAPVRRPDNIFREGPGGALIAPRLAAIDPTLLAAALVCAGGGARLPSGAAVTRLADRIGQGDDFAAGLAGARLEARGASLLIAREAGEFRRRALAPQRLCPGEPAVWDGRFEITAHRPGLAVAPLGGHARRLAPAERAALAALPAAVRPALPAIFDGDRVTCPILAEAAHVEVRSLVFERFEGAIGMICGEASIRRVAKAAGKP